MTDEKRGDRRAETARRHDDSDLIDDAEGLPAPGKVGRSGGNLQRDVATAHPEKRVADPEAADNLTKEQEVEHGGSSTAKADKGAT
jgi:hypothetical protein